MDIALLNELIYIQKNMVTVDAIGNHTNEWVDYYSCHATVSGSSGEGQYGVQKEDAAQTVDNTSLSFSVRYCEKAASVDVTGYRIIFKGEIYDIISIDHMKYKKKLLKFKCRKVRR